jgi:hypothetical protein
VLRLGPRENLKLHLSQPVKEVGVRLSSGKGGRSGGRAPVKGRGNEFLWQMKSDW